MQTQEHVGLRGWFEIIVLDANGKLKDMRKVNNLVVSAGKAQVAGLINSATTAYFKYLAIGSATSASGAGDTTLGSEATTTGGAGRALATTISRVTTSVTNDTARLAVTYSITATSVTVGEAGIFDSTSGGNMLARQPFATIALSSGDSLSTTWSVQVS